MRFGFVVVTALLLAGCSSGNAPPNSSSSGTDAVNWTVQVGRAFSPPPSEPWTVLDCDSSRATTVTQAGHLGVDNSTVERTVAALGSKLLTKQNSVYPSWILEGGGSAGLDAHVHAQRLHIYRPSGGLDRYDIQHGRTTVAALIEALDSPQSAWITASVSNQTAPSGATYIYGLVLQRFKDDTIPPRELISVRFWPDSLQLEVQPPVTIGSDPRLVDAEQFEPLVADYVTCRWPGELERSNAPPRPMVADGRLGWAFDFDGTPEPGGWNYKGAIVVDPWTGAIVAYVASIHRSA